MALPKYILALIKKNKNESKLRESLQQNIEVFLKENTAPFIENLLKTLSSKAYFPKETLDGSSKDNINSKSSVSSKGSTFETPSLFGGTMKEGSSLFGHQNLLLKFGGVEEKLSGLQDTIKELNEQVKILSQSSKKAVKPKFNAKNAQNNAISARKKRKHSNDVVIIDLEKEIDSNSHTPKAKKFRSEDQNEEIERLEKEIADKTLENMKKVSKIVKLGHQMEELNNKLQTTEKRLQNSEERASNMKEENIKLKHEIEELKRKLTASEENVKTENEIEYFDF